MKLVFSRQVFERSSNIKFHENPSSGSRVVPCGQTDGQTGMTKLIVAFLSFPNASEVVINSSRDTVSVNIESQRIHL
jgi:hypothetical protein